MSSSRKYYPAAESRTSRFQILALERQFPALFEGEFPFVHRDRVEVARVERVTKELLESTPHYRGATGSLVGIRDDEQFLLLNADLSVIGRVRQERDVIHNEAHWDNEFEYGETVGEAIARLGCAQEVGYILRRHTGYDVCDHFSVGGYSVTLYKLPHGWTITNWVDEQCQCARNHLSARISEIDAEGQVCQ